MKKFFSTLLFSLAFLAFMPPAHSQQIVKFSVDTLSDATTGYATSEVLNPVDLLTLQVVVTKVSGTVAGTAIPQVSVDGINFVDISTDTLTLTNVATNTKIWTFLKSPYRHYRIKVTTTGTQKSIPSAKILTRQPPK